MMLIVNGRSRYFDNLKEFTMVKPGYFTVMRNNTVYRIEGGKHAGGKRTEWFVDCSEWSGPIQCKSILKALTMLDRM